MSGRDAGSERLRNRDPIDPEFQPLAPQSSRNFATHYAENDFEPAVHTLYSEQLICRSSWLRPINLSELSNMSVAANSTC
jgi:hypothetical protein